MRHNSGLREDDRQETEGQRQPPEAEILLGLEELRWIMEGQEQPCSSGEIPEPREGHTEAERRACPPPTRCRSAQKLGRKSSVSCPAQGQDRGFNFNPNKEGSAAEARR
jgi:hypothetical protein